MTFAGGHLAIGVCEALKAGPEPVHLVGIDSSPIHTNLAVTDEVYLAPRADEPDYIDILSQIAEETRVDFIWPMHDAEVERVTEKVGDMPAKTWLPPYEVVKTSRNKLSTYQKLKAAEVPVPESMPVETQHDLDEAFERFDGELWLRAATGAGGAGAFKTGNPDHAKMWLDMHEGWGNFTAAEVLPGPGDYVQDSVWDHGNLIALQSQSRILRGTVSISLPGVTARGSATSDAPPEVDEIGMAAVRALMPEPHGIFRVDFFADADGVPRVTEVDAGRFTTNGPNNWYPTRPEINLPQTVIRLAFGEPVTFDTPMMNPYPKDLQYVAAINRPRIFVKRNEVDRQEAELKARRAR